jgi:hypothetical protein
MTSLVRDVMTTAVVTVEPRTPFTEVDAAAWSARRPSRSSPAS